MNLRGSRKNQNLLPVLYISSTPRGCNSVRYQYKNPQQTLSDQPLLRRFLSGIRQPAYRNILRTQLADDLPSEYIEHHKEPSMLEIFQQVSEMKLLLLCVSGVKTTPVFAWRYRFRRCLFVIMQFCSASWHSPFVYTVMTIKDLIPQKLIHDKRVIAYGVHWLWCCLAEKNIFVIFN